MKTPTSPGDSESRFPDFTLIALVIVVIAVVLFLTFEIWAPHFGDR